MLGPDDATRQIGLIGLGTMGRNLALNARDHGYSVIGTDSWASARAWRPDGIDVVEDHEALMRMLPTPRIILLMVKAGEQVDVEISGLSPLLEPGDIVIDGGNSRYQDTGRRAETLAALGIAHLGAGISGGAEGARRGAAIMVGGATEAWERARGFLSALAAPADDGALTIDHFGEGGAGHFVKMVHNGIEYAVMQAIAECHLLLTQLNGLDHGAVAAVFSGWAKGRAGGYLTEITAEILPERDPLGPGYLLDQISDVAGQKGTGSWTIEAALTHGIPVPSIAEAVIARQISSQPARQRASATRSAAQRTGAAAPVAIQDLEAALVSTMVAALAQGLDLYAAAAAAHGWHADRTRVLKVWRAGSILRCHLLGEMIDAIERERPFDTLMMPSAWREIVSAAIRAGLPVPVLASSLNYFDALASDRLPTALIQAQRDRFGNHGFHRRDRGGTHHGPWQHADPEAGT